MKGKNHMQTTDCRAAIEHLLAYLDDPKLHRAEADVAISHIRTCPYCESRVGHLIRALITDEEDPLTCQECQDLLPDYLQAEREGQAHEERWHAVALHLETCPHCAAEYATLSDLVALAYGERGVEPPRYPVPKLAFLHPSLAPDPNWYQVALDYGRAWLEKETGRWRQLWLSLPTLGDRQQRAPALAGLMGEVAVPPPSVHRTLAPANANFEIELTVVPDPTSDDADLCRVDVALTLQDRFGDFSAVQVTLLWGSDARTEETDALGQVSFTGLPCDQLASMRLIVTLPG
jgi:hypothetical protein